MGGTIGYMLYLGWSPLPRDAEQTSEPEESRGSG